MFINNLETAISKDELFYCGSLNLNRFLQENDLCYISSYTKKSTNKNIFIYIKSEKLKSLLLVWSENGKNKRVGGGE